MSDTAKFVLGAILTVALGAGSAFGAMKFTEGAMTERINGMIALYEERFRTTIADLEAHEASAWGHADSIENRHRIDMIDQRLAWISNTQYKQAKRDGLAVAPPPVDPEEGE